MNKEELLLDERQGYRSFAIAHNELVNKLHIIFDSIEKKINEISEKINNGFDKHNELVLEFEELKDKLKKDLVTDDGHYVNTEHLKKEIIKLEQPDKRPDVTIPKTKGRGKKRKVRSDKGRVRDINGKWNSTEK